MKRALVLVAALLALTACGPEKGQQCANAGDVYAHGSTVLTCTVTDNGLVWQ